MRILETDDKALLTSFSSTKRQILLILKQNGEITLSDLAKQLGISKMAILGHISDLEEMDIIERFKLRGGVGRPQLAIRLSNSSSDIFPKAYSSVTCSILKFIEDKLGRNAVYDALKVRQNEIKNYYTESINGSKFSDRIEQLSKIRNKEGYMVELKMMPGEDVYELLEYNCPILAVANDYFESCIVEQELFEDLLDANVKTTHRTIDGNNVCRFLIKPKKNQ